MFSWIPIHKEAIHKILGHRQSQGELLAILRKMEQLGLKVISLQDEDAEGKKFPLAEIDPFTFLASFNRGITKDNRRDNWKFLKEEWCLEAAVPDDFDGIPIAQNLQSWFFPFAGNREKDHVEHLWRLAAQVATRDIKQVDEALFDRCVELRLVGVHKLTIALFWINPDHFLPSDRKTTAYGTANGVTIAPTNYRTYRAWMQQMADKFGTDYPQQSHTAHLEAIKKKIDEPPDLPQDRQFWILAAGEGGWQWSAFQEQGIITIGWDGTPDLRQFRDKEEIRRVLQDMEQTDSSKKNDALACWEFVRAIEKKDIIFAKQGRTKILGYGLVEGDYVFEPDRQNHKHVRKVRWLSTGEWELPEGSKMPLKTLTNITEDPDLVNSIAKTVSLDLERLEERKGAQSPATGYWWLNANPKIWDMAETQVGERQTYTSHNEKGNKRQKYKYFQEVKPGDIVVGYVTSPQREVIGICKITKGLHATKEGEGIEFEKTEQLTEPISYETLQANPDLAKSEPIINNQGSLFKLSEQEYEIIRSLIDETHIPPAIDIIPYSKQAAMEGLFLPETQFDEMLNALKEKKNIVLQGAPGVGKTFVAKRLAYAFVGSNDPKRVETIQFHQSYSYEDFIQGFRPTAKGNFELKYGIFHQFCRRAQRHESQEKPYVFIIDEINRGNLSKIFGELMMLVEPDKRGKEYAIPLAYSQDADETFYIPENLYLIGMMNTADRSLAMVDYALRRRFRFITLRPEFGSNWFQRWLADAGVGSDLVKKIVSRMSALNEIIATDTKNLGPGYQIGHSYFCPTGKDLKPDENWYRRVIETEIVPLIQEYWFDDEQKVKEQWAALLA